MGGPPPPSSSQDGGEKQGVDFEDVGQQRSLEYMCPTLGIHVGCGPLESLKGITITASIRHQLQM